jgi:hypothetical protein
MSEYYALSGVAEGIFNMTMTILFGSLFIFASAAMFGLLIYGINYCFKMVEGNPTDHSDYDERE